MNFEQIQGQKFFWHRRVPPLNFSVFYLKTGFLAVESSELPWQMVFLTNSEWYNMYLLRKINRPLGIFCLGCIILQPTVIRVSPYTKLLLFIFKRKSEDAARNSSKLEVKASFLPFEPYWRVWAVQIIKQKWSGAKFYMKFNF